MIDPLIKALDYLVNYYTVKEKKYLLKNIRINNSLYFYIKI
jgi:hypothetical protein